ncbi:MAG TPA: efflux RND transporter periplasmic adaptor subunit [Vicinamibacterales bacterium]|nr:efflux RND transporter periplasmic adaptor subunit [Vicinamibacterales bacterium]
MATAPGSRPKVSSRHSRWWLALAIIVVAVAVGAWRYASRPEAPHYVTAAVTRGPVTRTVTASGTVNPMVTVQVGSYISGVIQSVSCDYNTHVTKGQLCAKIDPRPYQTVVDQDRANLAAARAQLQKDQAGQQYAHLTYTRNVDLATRGIVSQDVVDQAKSAADQAAAQVKLDRTEVTQRQAALQSAIVNLGYTNIVSPVEGTVVSRNVTPGQTVAASFQTPTLFLIATDLTKMQVDTNVSESDIGAIHTGSQATFTVEAFPNQSFAGTVTQVRQAPQTVQNVVTYDAVVSASNPKDSLKPGMTATVHIVTDQRADVLRVPDQALRYTPGGVTGTSGHASEQANVKPVGNEAGGQSGAVWVLRQGRPVRVPVTVGLDDDSHAEIVSGALKPGDQVIVSASAAGAPKSGARSRLRF